MRYNDWQQRRAGKPRRKQVSKLPVVLFEGILCARQDSQYLLVFSLDCQNFFCCLAPTSFLGRTAAWVNICDGG